MWGSVEKTEYMYWCLYTCMPLISFMLGFFGDVLMFMITKKLYHFGFLSGRKDNSGYRLNKIAVHVM